MDCAECHAAVVLGELPSLPIHVNRFLILRRGAYEHWLETAIESIKRN